MERSVVYAYGNIAPNLNKILWREFLNGRPRTQHKKGFAARVRLLYRPQLSPIKSLDPSISSTLLDETLLSSCLTIDNNPSERSPYVAVEQSPTELRNHPHIRGHPMTLQQLSRLPPEGRQNRHPVQG